jgi:hypothetical protein
MSCVHFFFVLELTILLSQPPECWDYSICTETLILQMIEQGLCASKVVVIPAQAWRMAPLTQTAARAQDIKWYGGTGEQGRGKNPVRDEASQEGS